MIANLAVPALVYGLMTDAESALFRRSRRHEAVSAAQAMADAPRPPVLDLRLCQDDRSVLLDDQGWPGMPSLTRAASPSSPEDELAQILHRIGPVVATGPLRQAWRQVFVLLGLEWGAGP